MNLALLAFFVLLLVVFIRKQRIFSRLAIAFFLLVLVASAVDAAVVSILPTVTAAGPKGMRDFVRALAQALIWIPYMARSRRVRATFVS